MRALSEPSLPGQMLFQASLSTPGWAAAPPTKPPNSKPFSQLFHVPVGLARVRPSQSPSSVSTDPSVSSPGQPVLLRGRWSLRFCSPSSCPCNLSTWERTPSSCPVCLLKPFLFLPGRTLQVQMASMSPPSAWPYVPDGPHTRPVSQQSHLSPAHIHMCMWKNVYQLGCRASTPTFWYILVFHLFFWTLGALPVATSHPI